MKAWVIHKITDLTKDSEPLKQVELQKPVVSEGELLLKVKACGICHTELDEIEGRTPPPNLPVVPGHQVVGIIEEHAGYRSDIKIGDRVGVAWIYKACGKCEFCRLGQENLCNNFVATGRDINGGYAEYMVVPEYFVYKIPDIFTDSQAAPLLCAGAIGYRSLMLCNPHDGQKIGLTGFGASGHLVLKLIRYKYPNTEVYVFARSEKERKFALELGAIWSGDTNDKPDELLDSIIDTTPVWKPILAALEVLKPGGRLVINAIRKESHDLEVLQKLDYSNHLWMEKEIKSVANVTRQDVSAFIKAATEMPFIPHVEEFAFEDANKAILEIKNRKIRGGKVILLKNQKK